MSNPAPGKSTSDSCIPAATTARAAPTVVTAPTEASPAKAGADPFFSGRKHFPELDGLRGLAIVLVLFCHYSQILPVHGALGASLEVAAFQGWIGVNLFFVLSGFLITGILFDAKGQNHYFRNFYARRTLRIFPLYYGILAVELAILLIIRLHSHAAWEHLHNPQKLWHSMPWLLTYTTNIGMAFWHVDTVIQGHFWSLAVEEQFYLVWPLMVFLLPWRKLIHACVALITTALILRFVFTAAGLGEFAAYSFTVCNFDALGLGGLIAILYRNRGTSQWLEKHAKAVLLIAGPLTAAAFILLIAFRMNPESVGNMSVRLIGQESRRVPVAARNGAVPNSESPMIAFPVHDDKGA
jgi:peptidoglycan/LPS O-acetylase OafA/YrhL